MQTWPEVHLLRYSQYISHSWAHLPEVLFHLQLPDEALQSQKLSISPFIYSGCMSSPYTHQLPLDCLNRLDFMSLGLLNKYQEKSCRGRMLTIRTVPLPGPITWPGDLCLVSTGPCFVPAHQLSSCVCWANSAIWAWATFVLKPSKDWQDHQVVTGKGWEESSPQDSPRHPWNIIWFLI